MTGDELLLGTADEHPVRSNTPNRTPGARAFRHWFAFIRRSEYMMNVRCGYGMVVAGSSVPALSHVWMVAQSLNITA